MPVVVPGAVITATIQTGNVSKTVTSVLIASVQILAANPMRKGFVVFNNSANSCYISPDNPVIAASCMRLVATFASWEVYGPAVYTGALYCIRNSGSGNVTVWELT